MDRYLVKHKRPAGIVAVLLSALALLIPGIPTYAAEGTQYELADNGIDLCGLPMLELSYFEKEVHTVPEVLAAVADLEQSIALLQQEQANSGFDVFGGMSAGTYEEAVTDDSRRNYERLNLTVGLRYPLLGSLADEQIDILEAGTTMKHRCYQEELVRNKSVQTLRAHYIHYWGAQEKMRITQSFLASEHETLHIIQKRTQAQYILSADKKEFESAYALARRNLAAVHTTAERSRGILRWVTQQDHGPFRAAFPVMPSPTVSVEELQTLVMNTHPEICFLQSTIEDQERLVQLSQSSPVDASLNVGSNISRDYPSGQNGYGAFVSFSFNFPVKIKGATDARERASVAALNKARQQLAAKSRDLLVEVEESCNQYHTASKNLTFASQRLQASQERVRENLLRSGFLAGDVVEKLQQSRISCYQAAWDYIDAHVHKLLAQSKLLTYTEFGKEHDQQRDVTVPEDDAQIIENNLLEEPIPLAEKAAPLIAPSSILRPDNDSHNTGLGFYVWDSRALLHRIQEDGTFWKKLREHAIDRLLISLDGEQIKTIHEPEHAEAWQEFWLAAAVHDLRVDLLLGDPHWILPAYRQNLVDIVKKLSFLPFSGLHLDLEPNQLDGEKFEEDYLLHELVRTVVAVRDVSPWPISMSIHPRYLATPPGIPCLGSSLHMLNIDEFTVMIYVANPERVAEIARPLLDKYPDTTISIAQSVEPILSREESYAQKGRNVFFDNMELLRTSLPQKNRGQIIVQSWKDFEAMKP